MNEAIPKLEELLRQEFPNAPIAGDATGLRIGSFPEWDSVAHFNLLILIEDTYGIRFSVDEMTELKGVDEIRETLAEKSVEA